MRFHQCSWKKSVMAILFILIIILLILYTPQMINPLFPTSHLRAISKMKLPQPIDHSHISIEEAIKQRRSVRQYQNEAISLQHLSQLLWAAQGITSSNGFRAAPSAGALYPLEIYVVSGNVTGLSPGIYHYLPSEHALELLVKGDKRNELSEAALAQNEVKYAAADIIMTAIYARTTNKYGHRGMQFVLLEAGHAAENICLQVISLGLGTVTIGAFNDSQVESILNLSKEETPLYIMPIGKK